MFYGSQTGTAEEYAIRLAKEAKSKFGISSLVCDPEEYDFTKLDVAAEEDKEDDDEGVCWGGHLEGL